MSLSAVSICELQRIFHGERRAIKPIILTSNLDDFWAGYFLADFGLRGDMFEGRRLMPENLSV